MNRILTLAFIIFAVCVGASQVALAQHAKKLPDAIAHKKVITVGELNFDQLDLHYEVVVDRCYGDTLAGLEAAALEIVGKALEQVVIKHAYHQEPPIAALQAKAKWIDESTRDSARLQCIKETFGKDTSSYYRLVVEPTLIDPRLHQYFAVDSIVQRYQRDTIQMFWRLIQADPSKFLQVAPDTIRIPKGTAATSELQKLGAVPESDDPFVQNVLSKLKDGQKWSNIVEDDQSYKIVQLLYQTGSYYYCRILTVQKSPFDPWFKAQVKSIPIVIHDKQLLAMIKERYPAVWWLEQTTFAP